VGLDYLTLDRASATLSGGEAQRIRLATQIGASLVGVIYILDEPSIGLHQRDNRRLIDTLLALRDMGNTVLVVEHDREMMESADWIIDLGPGPGRHGGDGSPGSDGLGRSDGSDRSGWRNGCHWARPRGSIGMGDHLHSYYDCNKVFVPWI